MTKSICMIMAHADDIEYSAGGTFAKYIASGYRALYGVMSRCNSGWTVTAEEGGRYTSSLDIVPRRRQEAEAAAALFGAELYYGDLLENCYTQRDGRLITPSFTGAAGACDDVPDGVPLVVAAGAGNWPEHPAVSELADLLATWEPEIVVGQSFQDRNPDHFCAALILVRAHQRAQGRASVGPLWVLVAVPGRTGVFPPLAGNRIVDVTGHEETALRALACHVSQGGHLAGTQESLRRKWRSWGERAGGASAEGFLVCAESA
jgi:LmbE family N-acetylglucosaminyl deacetylase